MKILIKKNFAFILFLSSIKSEEAKIKDSKTNSTTPQIVALIQTSNEKNCYNKPQTSEKIQKNSLKQQSKAELNEIITKIETSKPKSENIETENTNQVANTYKEINKTTIKKTTKNIKSPTKKENITKKKIKQKNKKRKKSRKMKNRGHKKAHKQFDII